MGNNVSEISYDPKTRTSKVTYNLIHTENGLESYKMEEVKNSSAEYAKFIDDLFVRFIRSKIRPEDYSRAFRTPFLHEQIEKNREELEKFYIVTDGNLFAKEDVEYREQTYFTFLETQRTTPCRYDITAPGVVWERLTDEHVLLIIILSNLDKKLPKRGFNTSQLFS